MSVSKLPSGRWRAQIHDPRVRHNVSVPQILRDGRSSYATKAEAKAAVADARKLLGRSEQPITVAEWRHRWLSDPLFARPKQSTMIHNTERTAAFAAAYASTPLAAVDFTIVSSWLAGAKNVGHVPSLRAMWNDAMSGKAGRLVESNPWSNLGLTKGPGNRYKEPPSEELVWSLINNARKLTSPDFAAWLQVAAFTGMRPGEVDGLRWTNVDLESETIKVKTQWNANSRTFTTPKTEGSIRDAIITPNARAALLSMPTDRAFCFVNTQGSHFTPSSRAYHWKAVRAAAGWKDSLYLATRHFFGSYAVNVLGLDAEDVAIALGHTDGGYLVRQLYGHKNKQQALDRVRASFKGVESADRPHSAHETGGLQG